MPEKGNLFAELAEKPGTVEALVRMIAIAITLNEESINPYVNTIKAAFPEWSGRTIEGKDMVELGSLLRIRFEPTTNTLDSTEAIDIIKGLTPEVGIAFGYVFLWLTAIECRKVTNEYFAGLSVNESLVRIVRIFVSSVEARRKGGEATKKWTRDIENLASPIFAELKRSNISDASAYQRTAAKLYADHDIEISPTTLRRHLINRSNA